MVRKRSGLIIGVVLIAALWLRVELLGMVWEHPERALRRDSETYIRVANNILGGNGFSQGENFPFEPSALRTPVYPLFISLNTALTGGSVYGLALVQKLINLITIWLVPYQKSFDS